MNAYHQNASSALENHFMKWRHNHYTSLVILIHGGFNMGGRGTFAAGNNVPFTYETVDNIHGVKVLKGLNGKHALPEESHSSNAYIKLRGNGTFHEMRIYGDNHEAILDIAYHPEPNIDNNRQSVLHIHRYGPGFNRHAAEPITKEIYEKYSKFFIGVPKYDKW